MNPARQTLALLTALVLVTPAQARKPAPPEMCLSAAQMAARETGVPLRVLLAITLTETGRQGEGGAVVPWPWALNQGGESHWFATRDEALEYLTAALAAGTTNIDLGCFQLNWRWHNAGFASAGAMMEPEENALYAANLLARLYADSGDWSVAAGAYHSATPAYASRYTARFDKIYAALDGETELAFADIPALTEEDARTNGFPLLQAGAAGSIGSLVPLSAAARPLIGG
jgi:hypothetical protein